MKLMKLYWKLMKIDWWKKIGEMILEIDEKKLVKQNWWKKLIKWNWWNEIDQMKLMKRNWSNEIDQMKLIKLNLKLIFNIF